MIIDKIKLLDVDVDVKCVDFDLISENGMGRSSIKNSSILVDSKMKDDMQRSVLMHELTHFIADMGSIELSESQIDAMSSGFNSFLSNNIDEIYMMYSIKRKIVV